MIRSKWVAGPFTARKANVNGYEVLDNGGVVAIWVMGDENARGVVASLNLGYDHGFFA
jgi:hypothetical protein